MTSPWGVVQSVHEVADGIQFVSTAGHGGFLLSPERLAKMPEKLKWPTRFYMSGSPWFEEDVEACRVVLAFPDCFNPSEVDSALDILKSAHPEVLT